MYIKQVGVSHSSTSDDTDDDENAGNEPLILELELDELSSRVPADLLESHPEQPSSSSFSPIVDTAEAVNQVMHNWCLMEHTVHVDYKIINAH